MKIKAFLRPLVIQFRSSRNYLRKLLMPQSHPPIGRQPAFDPETEKWFRNRIRSSKSYLEYGTGASTLLAADAQVPTISIESDRAYADAVRAALPDDNLTKIVAVDIGRVEDWGYPLWRFKTVGALQKWKFYPETGPAIIKTSNRFPDLVLVDGRFRVACCLCVVKAAIEQKQTTQILFDDYALRPQYSIVENLLGDSEAIGRSRLFHIEPKKISLTAVQALLNSAYSDFS
ncbi:MAG: hypothetical protein V7676_10700 [Parasphingorhabdus sp.]|uniref:hypothetical protein n=1 Tax=Parasphingorhabdus sp. TaxID=2709688 RepID=UPI003003A1E6